MGDQRHNARLWGSVWQKCMISNRESTKEERTIEKLTRRCKKAEESLDDLLW